MIRSGDKIMIIVPHDDDVTLSFGGLIHKYKENQFIVIVRCIGGPASNVSRAIRLNELSNAMNKLGNVKLIAGNGMFDGILSSIPESELVKEIDNYINEYKPDVILCGAKSEHTDHQALYRAFRGAARLKQGYMPRIFGIGTYPFSDQLYTENEGGKIFIKLNKSDFEAKIEAWKEHKSQQKVYPSPLSVEGVTTQSRYYGMNCGCEYAELIYLLREVE